MKSLPRLSCVNRAMEGGAGVEFVDLAEEARVRLNHLLEKLFTAEAVVGLAARRDCKKALLGPVLGRMCMALIEFIETLDSK